MTEIHICRLLNKQSVGTCTLLDGFLERKETKLFSGILPIIPLVIFSKGYL
jgi:hypothetical protein